MSNDKQQKLDLYREWKHSLILVIFGSALVISHWLKEICITLRDKK